MPVAPASPQGVPEPLLTPVSAHSDHPALHGAVHWPRDQVQVGAEGLGLLGVEMGLPWGGCPPTEPPLTVSPSFSSPWQRDTKRLRHDLPRRGHPGLLRVSADSEGAAGSAPQNPWGFACRVGVIPPSSCSSALPSHPALTSCAAGVPDFPFCPPGGLPGTCSHQPWDLRVTFDI